MDNPELVTVERFGYDNNYCIRDQARDYFYNHQGKIRAYSQPSNAVAFLRRSGYAWIAKMPSGKTIYINCVSPEDKELFGCHVWEKKNAVTTIDKDGMYDVWRCKLCRQEVKRFGLSGRPGDGVCKKNPRQ